MKQLDKAQDSPLTLKQLREMNGQPGYWAEEKRWGIICVDSAGRWAGVPFFKFRGDGVFFEYNIKSRRMKIYRYPSPAKLVREAWEPCRNCKDGKVEIEIPAFEALSACNQYMNHGPLRVSLPYPFCPYCGRPMTDAAWKLLERRLTNQ